MFQRKLTFQQAIEICLQQKYCNFSGRASRSEYWWFYLFTLLVSAVITFIGKITGLTTLFSTINLIVGIGLLLPSLGVAVRRLHDIGKSGWWLLIGLIPIVGTILLIVWYCKDSDNFPNEYGDIPYLEGGVPPVQQ